METLLKYAQQIGSCVAVFCQLLAMFVILIGAAKAAMIYLKDIFTKYKAKHAMRESRFEVGHALSLALAFLIGASILNTTLAPTWNEIGQLAAIIAIRIGLNYFLVRDLREQEQGQVRDQAEQPRA